MQDNRKLSALIIVCAGIVFAGLALLFKTMHWRGAGLLTEITMPVIGIGLTLFVVRAIRKN